MKKKYLLKLLSKSSFRILILFLFLLNIQNAFSQKSKCSASLEVQNNQDSKKAGESGTFYGLTLTNKADKVTKFKISLEKSEEDNDHHKNYAHKRNNKKNVDLIAEIVDVNNVKLKESFQEKNNKHGVFVTLKKNENFNFFVKFKTPKNTEFGSVNLSEVNVTSNECKGFKVGKVLITEIIEGE